MQQQAIRTVNAPIHAAITLPGSSSMTLRAIMLAALADGASEISEMHIDDKTRTLLQGLRQFGIIIQLDEYSRSCIVAGCNGTLPKKQASIDCEHSGLVTKFLLAAGASTAGVYYFNGTAQTRKKSLTELMSILHSQGAQLIPSDNQHMPFTLVGADILKGGEIHLHHHLSQVTSAILMVTPYAQMPLRLKGPGLSSPIIHLTCAMMNEFDVYTQHTQDNCITLSTPQYYQPRNFTIEPDLSTAAYFFAAAAITHGTVCTQPINRFQSKQSDIQFISILEKMGCLAIEKPDAFILKGPIELQGVEVNFQHFTDILFALAAIAPLAHSATKITLHGSFSSKEMNNIFLFLDQLTLLGAQIEKGADWFCIAPSQLHGILVNTHQEASFAKAFSLLGLIVPNIMINAAQRTFSNSDLFYSLWDDLFEHAEIQ